MDLPKSSSQPLQVLSSEGSSANFACGKRWCKWPVWPENYFRSLKNHICKQIWWHLININMYRLTICLHVYGHSFEKDTSSCRILLAYHALLLPAPPCQIGQGTYPWDSHQQLRISPPSPRRKIGWEGVFSFQALVHDFCWRKSYPHPTWRVKESWDLCSNMETSEDVHPSFLFAFTLWSFHHPEGWHPQPSDKFQPQSCCIVPRPVGRNIHLSGTWKEMPAVEYNYYRIYKNDNRTRREWLPRNFRSPECFSTQSQAPLILVTHAQHWLYILLENPLRRLRSKCTCHSRWSLG